MSGCSDMTESNTPDVYYKINGGGSSVLLRIDNKSEKNYNLAIISQYKDDLLACIFSARMDFSSGTTKTELLNSPGCYRSKDLSFFGKLAGDYWSVSLMNQ